MTFVCRCAFKHSSIHSCTSKSDILYKYAMPVGVSWWNVSQREDGFPEGRAQGKTILLRGDIPSGYPHWHGIFVLLYHTNANLVKYQLKQQWLPVDPVRMVDVLPVDISQVDMMEWPTFVSQSRLSIFKWGIIKGIACIFWNWIKGDCILFRMISEYMGTSCTFCACTCSIALV